MIELPNEISEEYIFELDFSKAQELEAQGKYEEAEKQYRHLLLKAKSVKVQDNIIERIRKMKEKQDIVEDEEDRQEAATIYDFKISKRKFDDVIGYKKHKRIFQRVIGLPLKNDEGFVHFNLSKSTGIILYGPPGTGKTSLVQALSGEFQLPMLAVKVSDILSPHVGEAEEKIRTAFEEAEAKQPAILFFDEIDLLGMERGKGSTEGTGAEQRSTITEMLQQISDVHDDKTTKVFIIGATNMPWDIDVALTRSGRIEHFFYIRPPNLKERIDIFKYYLELGKKDYAKISKFGMLQLGIASIRYSGADIEKIVTQSKLMVLEKKGSSALITKGDILRIIRDKDLGRSSLEEWYMKAKAVYIKSSKVSVQRTGFLGRKKQKIRTEEQGKLNEADIKIFKPIIKDIKRTMRWWKLNTLIKFFARL